MFNVPAVYFTLVLHTWPIDRYKTIIGGPVFHSDSDLIKLCYLYLTMMIGGVGEGGAGVGMWEEGSHNSFTMTQLS